MQVREILNQKNAVCSISHAETVYSAAKIMAEKNIGVIAVLNHKRLVGVISERDILRRVVSKDLDPHRMFVGDIMSTNLVVAAPTDSFESCEQKMRDAHCRHVLIVDGTKLVGVVSLRDILDSSLLPKDQQVTVDEEMIWNRHVPVEM